MIRLVANRTLPLSFRSLSCAYPSWSGLPNASFRIHSTRRFSLYKLGGPIDAEPEDNPDLFDVLLTDVSYKSLTEDVSEKLGYKYLSRAPKTDLLKMSPQIKGYLFGARSRPFFPFITTFNNQSHYVHFLFDTSSPFTYLSYEACNTFFGTSLVPVEFSVELNGYTTLIRPVPAKAHFKDVNILGADFCTLNQVVGVVDYHTRESTLLFKRLLRPKQKQVVLQL